MGKKAKNASCDPNVIVMKAGATVARKHKIKPNEDIMDNKKKWFPEDRVPHGLSRVEVFTTQHKTGMEDFYTVYFDGHDNGDYNDIATWICNVLPPGVNPTGNFVISHDVYDDETDKFVRKPIDKTLRELKQLFSK